MMCLDRFSFAGPCRNGSEMDAVMEQKSSSGLWSSAERTFHPSERNRKVRWTDNILQPP